MADSQLAAAIILAAGKGTRIKSSIPKVMLEMNGRSLVGHANDAVGGLSPRYTVFVVRHERDRVVAHLQEINADALISDQDEIKGTGRAAWCGLQALPADLTGPVLIVAGDSPMFTTEALQGLLDSHGTNAVTVLSTVVADPHGYGRIIRAKNTDEIVGIVEEKDASEERRRIHEIGTSTYIFDADFLRESLQTLGTDNSQGEMYLTDVIARAAESGAGVGSYILSDNIQAEGVNDLVQLANLRSVKNRRIQEAWMRTGVQIIDPTTTYIDVDVTLDPDAVIKPGTILGGSTHVGAFAVVGPHSEVTNSNIGEHAKVPHAVVTNATIGAGEEIAPFSAIDGGGE